MSGEKKIKITQIRSTIERPERQKRTIEALGLGRIRKSVVKTDTPQIRGMIAKVQHLVRVEEA
ncbi:MAG TPA: 50S ribosomal protein L30 [Candidatus Kryptobacter bacterium]|jgi:large subunit ribosomal protein L30|nr:MAG: 50S ribosomal protein L30 [Ignavibacteriae bacterium 37-53-5]HQT90743.1 50S ribosomal protein L30 [Candidatus Kryptobacter bacterium]